MSSLLLLLLILFPLLMQNIQRAIKLYFYYCFDLVAFFTTTNCSHTKIDKMQTVPRFPGRSTFHLSLPQMPGSGEGVFFFLANAECEFGMNEVDNGGLNFITIIYIHPNVSCLPVKMYLYSQYSCAVRCNKYNIYSDRILLIDLVNIS